MNIEHNKYIHHTTFKYLDLEMLPDDTIWLRSDVVSERSGPGRGGGVAGLEPRPLWSSDKMEEKRSEEGFVLTWLCVSEQEEVWENWSNSIWASTAIFSILLNSA